MITIIAVDDEQDFVDVIDAYLKNYDDFMVFPYTSPLTALDAIRKHNPDIVLSDYRMPGLDGISFFQEVRKISPVIPFILLTAMDTTSIILDAINAGVDFVQLKTDEPSILFADIAQKIRSAVLKRRAEEGILTGIRQRDFFIRVQRDLINHISAASTLHEISEAGLASILCLAQSTRGCITLFYLNTGGTDLQVTSNLSPETDSWFIAESARKDRVQTDIMYNTVPGTATGTRVTRGHIPVFSKDHLLGVLSFLSDTKHPISHEVQDTMEILASHLGNAIVRIRSEELVRVREKELSELYHAMEELVIVADLDGTILNLNQAVTRTLGYEEEELIGQPIHILYPADSRDAIVIQFIGLTENKGKIQNTYPFLTRDGNTIPVDTRGTMGQWGDRPVLFCISRDISERLQAERDLHDYYERIQAILSSSTARIYMKDENLRYRAANRPFLSFLETELTSVEGMTDEDLFPPEVAAQHRQVEMQVITSDIPAYNCEEEITNREKKKVSLISSVVPVHDQDGTVTGIVGTSLDITDLVSTRQELMTRDRISSAVSSIAYLFVRSEDWESRIPLCLSLLGESTEKDMVFFARLEESDSKESCHIISSWSKTHHEEPVPEEWNDLLRKVIQKRRKSLESNPVAQGSVRKILPEESIVYEAVSPLMYLLLGIYTSDSLWGVIGILCFHSQDLIPSAEIDTLITAAGIIGSVIERYQTEELFRRPVERSLVGIYLMQDFGIVYANPRMSEILGYSRNELEKMIISSLFHEEDRALAIKNHQQVISRPDETYDYEIRAVTADGRIIYLENLISQFTYQGHPAVIGSIMDITEKKISETNLLRSLAEKEILLREVHHRVKNNMQIIVSLLRMQSSMIEDPNIVGILQEGKNRILSMAIIHEKLYRTDNLVSVNLREYLQSLGETMVADFSGDESTITLDIACDPDIEMTIDAGIPLGLIINELLTNTFKHGLRAGEQGTITIRVSRNQPEWIDITYRDTGKGLPESFILENCDSLGMQLIQNLVFQSSGEIRMESDNGIFVQMKIPLSEGFMIREGTDATGE
ncbi:MAG: PAS domain S-box protein [Methanospirillaceae archaeon]|nr:PAS domain S-box protein [Methanospirillaceae archaeon]